MSITRAVLVKSMVIPFYRQNAGLFAFLLFIMLAAVGRANGSGLLEYHFSLIKGILTNFQFLLFVLFAWFLYAVKCSQFIVGRLEQRDYHFLSLLSLKKPGGVFGNLFLVQLLILVPILIYGGIMVWIGATHRFWTNSMMIVLFFAVISISGAMRYRYILSHPARKRSSVFGKVFSLTGHSSCWLILIRFIRSSGKILFLAIKTASCLILFGLIYGQSGDHSGLQMTTLFYSFGLLGHGVLIYTVRNWEENDLKFYRGMPVSLLQRFNQYAIFYLLIFVPEIIVIVCLTPLYISYSNALLFIFFGYGALLFLNSLLFIRIFGKFEYLKIVSGLYLLIFIVVLTGLFPVFCIGLFFSSVYIFFRYYYRLLI